MERMLFDVENQKSIPGFSSISGDGSKIEIIISGKMVITVPDQERNDLVYKMLEKNFGLIFYKNEKIEEFPYYPVPMIAFFAFDRNGNQFGTIGGTGGIGDDNFAVGYINKDGKYGKVVNSFKEFFELVNYYPKWSEFIDCEINGSVNDLSELIQNPIKMDGEYLTIQNDIANRFKIGKNEHIINQLISNLKEEPEFIVYQSIDEAKNENEFVSACISESNIKSLLT